MNAQPQTCSACGSSGIVAGIKVGQTAEAGSVGLSYKTGFIVIGTEPFLADLCRACGRVRLYVENRDRKWLTD
jgi:hypothetical protein